MIPWLWTTPNRQPIHPQNRPPNRSKRWSTASSRSSGSSGRSFGPSKDALRAVGGVTGPAWRQVTSVESRIPVTVTMAVAIALMAVLPCRIANHPRWVVPGLASVLLLVVLVVNPMRVDANSRRLRPIAFALLAVISIGNAISAGRLIVDLVNATGIRTPETLLLTGAAIWTTNMIVFAVWYWEFDRGGPAARAMALQTRIRTSCSRR